MGVLKTILITIALSYLFNFLYYWLVNNGVGVYHYNHQPGNCRIIPGIECGSEQISVSKDGLAFITNGYKGVTNCHPDFLEGNLFLFDFNQPEQNVTKLIIESKTLTNKKFEPHGMDILEDLEKRTILLYVVNHANDKDCIEVFRFDRSNPHYLFHIHTINNENFICLNDITLVDKNRFYVTNFQRICHSYPFMLKVEILLKLKTANIVYYDNGKSNVMADGESFFNGITLSLDKKQVFCVLTTSGQMFVFDRNLKTGKLSLRQKLHIGHHPDNVFLDPKSGYLYIGIIKHGFELLASSENRSNYMTASGIKVIPKTSKYDEIEVEEVFHYYGQDFITGVSSVVYYKGQYLFGSVFHKLAYCKDRE